MSKRHVMTKRNVVAMREAKQSNVGASPIPKSIKVAGDGVNTGGQFTLLMSAVISDLLDGRITPSVGNAVCNAGGKLLKVVEMQQRWGTQKTDGAQRDLALTPLGIAK